MVKVQGITSGRGKAMYLSHSVPSCLIHHLSLEAEDVILMLNNLIYKFFVQIIRLHSRVTRITWHYFTAAAMPSCYENRIKVVCKEANCSITESEASVMAAPKSQKQKDLEQRLLVLFGEAARAVFPQIQEVCIPLPSLLQYAFPLSNWTNRWWMQSAKR